MRNLLALGALGLLAFAGIGWYLGWYKVQTTPGTNGHRQIEIDLNTNKIKADVNQGETKVHDWLNDKNNTQSTNSPSTPGTTTSFRPTDSSSFIFPGSSPPAPSGSPTLPTPQ